jgi:hypothetical protein
MGQLNKSVDPATSFLSGLIAKECRWFFLKRFIQFFELWQSHYLLHLILGIPKWFWIVVHVIDIVCVHMCAP